MGFPHNPPICNATDGKTLTLTRKIMDERLDALADSLRNSEVIAAIQRAAKQCSVDPILVGGLLRDAIMKRPSLDIDLAVPADAFGFSRVLAEQTGGTFVPLDEKHGSARVALPDKSIVDVTDLRRQTLEDDLLARDLTCNALAAPLSAFLNHGAKAVIDPGGGMQDICKQVIRPFDETNFLDDPLRMLRAFRYAAIFGFALPPATLKAIRRYADHLPLMASERVFLEIQLIFRSGKARTVLPAMLHSGVLSALFGFFSPNEISAWVGRAGWIERVMEQRPLQPGFETLADESAGFRLVTMLAASMPGAHITDLIVALRLGRQITGRVMRVIMALVSVRRLVREHPVDQDFLNITARIVLALRDDRLAPWLIFASENEEEAVFRTLERAERITRRLILPVVQAPPLITGGELIKELDAAPGHWVSEVLEEIFFHRLAGELPTREAAIDFARHYRRHPGAR